MQDLRATRALPLHKDEQPRGMEIGIPSGIDKREIKGTTPLGDAWGHVRSHQ
jgi:hypothetical protein